MLRLRSAVWLLSCLAVGVVGYGVRYVQDQLREANAPVVVPEQRLAELAAAGCPSRRPTAEETRLLSLAFVPTAADQADQIVLEPIKGRSWCVSRFYVPSNSTLQGVSTIRIVSDRQVRMDVFLGVDTELARRSRPSFSLELLKTDGRIYVFNGLTKQLFESSPDAPTMHLVR